MQSNIRFAKERDIPLILSFIRELAEDEKLLHEVVATEEGLKKTLFGKETYAKVLLAYLNDEAVGFVLFFHNYSTFLGKPGVYIEDLYVHPNARGVGIGKQLLAYLAKYAKENDFGRVEWWVLDWNQDAIEFYHKIGAKPMSEWTVYRLTGEPLESLAVR